MEKKSARGNCINKRQKELLVERVQQYPKLLTGKFDNEFTHKMARELWTKIGNELNEIPNGANKEWDQWRKTWQDLKKNAKAKSSRITNHMRGTGGGQPSEENLTEIEEEIVNTICPTLINGHVQVNESAMEIDLNSDESNKENEIDETISREHTYATTSSSATNDVFLPNKPKLNKTKRLQTSLNISQGLLKVSEGKYGLDKEYCSAKIALIEKDQNARREYEHKKLEILQKTQDTLSAILTELKTLTVIATEK